ncbi:unnamed protein product [Boreogadus saida]
MSYSTFLGLLHGSNWRCSSTQLDDHHSLVLNGSLVHILVSFYRQHLYREGEADLIFTSTSRLVVLLYLLKDLHMS